MKSCFHFRTAAMVQVNRGCVSNLSCTDHAWYICNIEIISLAEYLRGRHHSCHPAREGDIMNCLPTCDVLLANENDCIILKDNTYPNKSKCFNKGSVLWQYFLPEGFVDFDCGQ